MANDRIEVGEIAPDFVLPNSSGVVQKLSDFQGKSEIVLFFYPKDDSPACRAEACAFRDSYNEFQKAGAEVIGISANTSESQEQFAKKRKLPYRLVSDQEGTLQRLYKVPKTFGFIAGRVTYVIDRQGIVRHIFNSQFRPVKHIQEALAALRNLRGHV
jgi:peroxiredoxin Q/BCP